MKLQRCFNINKLILKIYLLFTGKAALTPQKLSQGFKTTWNADYGNSKNGNSADFAV